MRRATTEAKNRPDWTTTDQTIFDNSYNIVVIILEIGYDDNCLK